MATANSPYNISAVAANANLNATTMAPFITAVNNVMNGTTDAVVCCIGDSLTAGYYSSTAGVTAAQFNAWPALVARLFTAVGIPSVDSGVTPPPTGLTDSRWVTSGNWGKTTVSGLGIGGQTGAQGATIRAAYHCVTPFTGSLVVTPGIVWNEIDIYLCGTTAGNGVSGVATASGGAPVNFTTAYSLGNNWQKVTAVAASASASNTVTITASGNFIVGFMDARNSTVKQLRFLNMGVGGSRADGWNTKLTATEDLGGRRLVEMIAPHAGIISLGTNEAVQILTAPVAPTSYYSAISTLVSTVRLSGVPILMPQVITNPASSLGAGGLATQWERIYRSELVPRLGSAVPLIDLFSRSAEYFDKGYMHSDKLHINDLGYQDAAICIFRALMGN